MMTVVVVVIDESKDSLIKRHAVFLRLDVNIVIFYRSPKSFYQDVVLCPAPAVHTDLISGCSAHVGQVLVLRKAFSVPWLQRPVNVRAGGGAPQTAHPVIPVGTSGGTAAGRPCRLGLCYTAGPTGFGTIEDAITLSAGLTLVRR